VPPAISSVLEKSLLTLSTLPPAPAEASHSAQPAVMRCGELQRYCVSDSCRIDDEHALRCFGYDAHAALAHKSPNDDSRSNGTQCDDIYIRTMISSSILFC